MMILGRKPKPNQVTKIGAKTILGTISSVTASGIEGLAQDGREGDQQRQRHAQQDGDGEAARCVSHAGDQRVLGRCAGMLRTNWHQDRATAAG